MIKKLAFEATDEIPSPLILTQAQEKISVLGIQDFL